MARRSVDHLPTPAAALVALLFTAQPGLGQPADASRAALLYREGRCDEAIPGLASALDRRPESLTLRKLLGRCLLQQSRWDEAREQFERVLELSPEDGDARSGLHAAMAAIQEPVQARQSELFESRSAAESRLEITRRLRQAEELIGLDRRQEARVILAGILVDDPSHVDAAKRLAELHSAERRFAAAARLYRVVHERAPDDTGLLLRIARNLTWAEDVPAAIDAYEAYLARAPGDHDAALALADARARFGLCHEALPGYERLVEARPDDPRARLGVAVCLDQAGERERAIDAYVEVLRLDPDNPVALAARERRRQDFEERHLRRAFDAIRDRRLDEATEHLLAHLEGAPDDHAALRELAAVYSWSGRYGQAIRRYGEYLEKVPDDDAVLRALARTQAWAGDFEASSLSYQRLAERGAARVDDYEQLLKVLEWGDRMGEAEPWIEALLAKDPENADALAARVTLRERAGLEARRSAESLTAAERFDEARAVYERYLEERGPDPEIELRICRLYAWAGRHDEALASYRDFLERNPDDLQARLELANELGWSGKHLEAEPQYRSVLEEDPERVEALVGLARALDALGGDPFQVRTFYRRAVEVDPGNPEAVKGLASIRFRVRPTGELRERAYFDSDELDASRLTAAAAIRLPGNVNLRPYYRHLYYSQTRPVVGDAPAVADLNRRISDAGGTWSSHGFGVGVEAGLDERWRLEGSLGLDTWGDRTTLAAEAAAGLQLGPTRLRADFVTEDAVGELLTVASLAAGIRVDRASLSGERILPGRVRAWGLVGLAWYGAGGTPDFAGAFPENRQYRLALRLDRPLGKVVRLGYVLRGTGFSEDSPLHFSPDRYQAHLAWLSASRTLESWSWSVDAELGVADVDGVGATEWSLSGALRWRLSDDLALRATYRAARSQTGLETGRPYQSHGIDFGLDKTF